MALVAIAIAAAFLYDGRNLVPGILEPVGPGTIPNATVLDRRSRLVAGDADPQPARTAAEPGEPALAGERWRDLAVLVVVTCAYVAVLGFGLVRYSIATAVFLALTIVWLAEDRRRACARCARGRRWCSASGSTTCSATFS